MEYLWLAIGWVVYFVIHSLLATHEVKDFAYSYGLSAQKYRLFYNVFALLTLVPVLLLSMNIQPAYVFSPGQILKLAGLILAGYGVVIAMKAFKNYDGRAFLGIGPMRHEEFKSGGMLKYVRHPVYAASILILIGYFLFDPKLSTLLSVSMLILYFMIGSRFEERKLIREYGEDYRQYMKKTPMLIPKFWKKG